MIWSLEFLNRLKMVFLKQIGNADDKIENLIKLRNTNQKAFDKIMDDATNYFKESLEMVRYFYRNLNIEDFIYNVKYDLISFLQNEINKDITLLECFFILLKKYIDNEKHYSSLSVYSNENYTNDMMSFLSTLICDIVPLFLRMFKIEAANNYYKDNNNFFSEFYQLEHVSHKS